MTERTDPNAPRADGTDQRLREAADAARRAGARIDRDRMLARIEAGPSARRGWQLAAAAAATAVVVVVAVAVAGGGLDRPVVTDPIGSPTPEQPSPTAEPGPTASPSPGGTQGPGTAPTTPPTQQGAACSAAGLEPTPEPQPELPDAVADLRDRIADRAVACDLDGLAALAHDQFSFTFGGAEDPVAFWESVEEDAAAGDARPMEALRLVLDTPPGRMERASGGGAEYWIWPRLHLLEPDAPAAEVDAAIDELVATGLHTRAELEEMWEQGGAYFGYRVFVEVPDDTGEARWIVFIAGD